MLFGCRDHGEDLFCEETSSLERMKEKGGLTLTRQTAFSRLERKEYVQVLREIMKKNMLTLYGLQTFFETNKEGVEFSRSEQKSDRSV